MNEEMCRKIAVKLNKFIFTNTAEIIPLWGGDVFERFKQCFFNALGEEDKNLVFTKATPIGQLSQPNQFLAFILFYRALVVTEAIKKTLRYDVAREINHYVIDEFKKHIAFLDWDDMFQQLYGTYCLSLHDNRYSFDGAHFLVDKVIEFAERQTNYQCPKEGKDFIMYEIRSFEELLPDMVASIIRDLPIIYGLFAGKGIGPYKWILAALHSLNIEFK